MLGARHNNLKNINVEIPLGLFVCVTGVSGSGKSSLVNDILMESLRQRDGKRPDLAEEEETENGQSHAVGSHDRITGTEYIDKVIDIDQVAHWPYAAFQSGNLHQGLR